MDYETHQDAPLHCPLCMPGPLLLNNNLLVRRDRMRRGIRSASLP